MVGITVFLFTLIAIGEGLSVCDCPRRKFTCDTCECVPRHRECDGNEDCSDASDERHCHVPSCGNEYRCDSNRCIPHSWVCDGDPDCQDSTDEFNCPPRNCSKTELVCDNGECVLAKSWCDGDADCADGSDEKCGFRSCSADLFTCSDGSCITKTWVCDGVKDCTDGSDEIDCPTKDTGSMCSKEEFACKTNNICILNAFRCDGENDCGDSSDEAGCEMHGTCQGSDFQCPSGLCINKTWRCDGYFDCVDGSDETNCTYSGCGPNTFMCSVGNCIRNNFVCDGDRDCKDGSDEENCDSCLPNQFHCISGECIGKNKRCNGRQECIDNSDEFNCDKSPNCENLALKCSYKCINTKYGAKCICRHGYQLIDNHTCTDINECALYPCSQHCTNTEGSFYCSCTTGYQLKPDGRGCKALGGRAYLILANRFDIRKLRPDRSEYKSIIDGLENAIALDFHHRRRLMFYCDLNLNVIMRSRTDGTQLKTIVDSGLDQPGGVAVDWIHDKLFWTDAGTSRIEVSNLDGSYRKVLLWTNMAKPRAIVTYPDKGSIYWTDWGDEPKIESSAMDGSDRQVLVRHNLLWPNGLTVDYGADRLYWADAKHHVIESSDLDGKNRKVVLNKGLPHPFALTLFEDDLYWTDWQTKSVRRVHKLTGTGIKTVHSVNSDPMDIHIFHRQRQMRAGKNHCGRHNGGCSHLCLPTRTSFSCACPTGMRLLKDTSNCSSKMDTFLLFATHRNLLRISFDTPELMDQVISVSGLRSVIAVDYHQPSNSVFWTDIGKSQVTISRANWDGSGQRVIVGTNLQNPTGLAVDWVGGNLYWTDSGLDRIEVSRLDGSLRTILVWEGLDRPRDILVEPIRGYMFWTDWGKHPYIEQMGMDGKGRLPIVRHNLTWPNGLAFDYDSNRLFWTDAGTRTIESCSIHGLGRKVILAVNLHHPFGLTVYRDKLYWTDWESRTIEAANKNDGSRRRVLLSRRSDLMDIHMYHSRLPRIASACHIKNGGCSHLCLIAPLPRGHSCACPTGFLMSPNNRTCKTHMDNYLVFAHKSDIRVLSLDVKYHVDVVLPLKGLHNVVAVAVDSLNNRIYWSDSSVDQIKSSSVDGTDVTSVVTTDLDITDGLAVDPIGQKLYWTDAGMRCIEVANLDGSHRKVLVWKNVDSPRAIALYYELGFMYWTDWGESPSIKRANMDGNDEKVLIFRNLLWPNGLVIDKSTQRLIWADAKTEVIECSDLNGKFRRVLVNRVHHPYGLTISGNFIYWTDWQTRSILRANHLTGSQTQTVISNMIGLKDIEASQPPTNVKNRCQNNNGCSHLCLPVPRGAVCACPTGLRLQRDRKTCDNLPGAFLLLAKRSSLARISLDTLDMRSASLQLNGIRNVISVDFHWKLGLVFYSDVYYGYIRSSQWNGHDNRTVVATQLHMVSCITVDWMANNLYWINTGFKKIEVSRLDGSSRKVVIYEHLDEPRTMVLYPKGGLMYWTDWGSQPRVERSYMDGSGRYVIRAHLGQPCGLTIDHENQRLYWVDSKFGRVETTDLLGHNHYKFIRNIHHPFSLAILQNHIYWSDWQTGEITRASKFTGRPIATVSHNIHRVMDLRGVSTNVQTGSNLCSIANGGCSHLCLRVVIGRVCACPDVPDDRPCTPIEPVVNNQPRRKTLKKPKTRCTLTSIRSGACNQTTNQTSDIIIFNTKCKINPITGTCTDRKTESLPIGEPSRNDIYIIMGIILSVVVIIFVIGLLIFCRRHQRHNVSRDLKTLNYLNPNFQKSSFDSLSFDRRSDRSLIGVRYSSQRLSGLSSGDEDKSDVELIKLVKGHRSGGSHARRPVTHSNQYTSLRCSTVSTITDVGDVSTDYDQSTVSSTRQLVS